MDGQGGTGRVKRRTFCSFFLSSAQALMSSPCILWLDPEGPQADTHPSQATALWWLIPTNHLS